MNQRSYDYWTQYWAIYHAWMAAGLAVPLAFLHTLEAARRRSAPRS